MGIIVKKKLGSKSSITPKAKVQIIDIKSARRVYSISVPDLNVKYNTSNMKPNTKGISLLPISSSN